MMEAFEQTRNRLSMAWSVQAQTGLGRLVCAQIGWAAHDLEAFCRHARRTTIGTDDVRLLARRNPDILVAIDRAVGGTASSSSGTTIRTD